MCSSTNASWRAGSSRASGRPAQPVAASASLEAPAVGADEDGALLLPELTAERTAAECAGERAFLVGEGHHVDPAPEDARRLQRGDHPEAAVQPATGRHRVDVGPREDGPRLRAATEDVADAVDLGLQAGGGEAPGEPLAGADVVLRVRGPMHAAAAAADRAELVEVGEHARAVDRHRAHSGGNSRRQCSAISRPVANQTPSCASAWSRNRARPWARPGRPTVRSCSPTGMSRGLRAPSA